MEVKMGHVCFIPGTTDFFIAYGDHPEWGTAHTVRRRGWGRRRAGLLWRELAVGCSAAARGMRTVATAVCLTHAFHFLRCAPPAAGVGQGGRVVCHRLHHLAALQVRRCAPSSSPSPCVGLLWRCCVAALLLFECACTGACQHAAPQRPDDSPAPRPTTCPALQAGDPPRVRHSDAHAAAGGAAAHRGGGRQDVERPAGPAEGPVIGGPRLWRRPCPPCSAARPALTKVWDSRDYCSVNVGRMHAEECMQRRAYRREYRMRASGNKMGLVGDA